MTKDPPADLVIDALTTFPDEAAARILGAAGMDFQYEIDPEERAFLLDGILSPFGASPAETATDDGTFTAALRLPDRDCAIKAAGELCRRGYRPGPETSDGEILLARSPADLCRLVFGK